MSDDRLAESMGCPTLREKLFRVWFDRSSAAFINAPERAVIKVLTTMAAGPATLAWQIHIGEMLVKHRHDGDGVDERSVRSRLGDLRALRDRLRRAP